MIAVTILESSGRDENYDSNEMKSNHKHNSNEGNGNKANRQITSNNSDCYGDNHNNRWRE